MKISTPIPTLLSLAYSFIALSPGYALEYREGTPMTMTCKEYIELQPEYRPSVVYWVVNRDNNFSGPKYVSMHTAITVWVPEILKKCERNKNLKLGDIVAHK